MKLLGYVGVLAIAGFMIGCTAERKSTPNASLVFKVAQPHEVDEREYRIDPPDEIILKAPAIKELDGIKQEVRPDGKLAINLLGDVKVAGLTPQEVSKRLNEAAAKYYRNPEIRIEVTPKSKFYMVFGEGATQPGKKPYTGHDTIVKALAECGFSQAGWPQQVRLSRPAKNGQLEATAVVDFTEVYEYARFTQNYVIEEGDIVYIPPSPLWSFNRNMEKVLGPLTGASMVGGGVTGGGGFR